MALVVSDNGGGLGFDFRLSGIKGVGVSGSAPVSKEHGKSQPLCAICLSLSHYRRNRLSLGD